MRVVAHRGGKGHGRENDAQTIEKVLPYKPDIIEVDVRKSRDGVLYCHHGSVPLGVIAASFFYHLSFGSIQRLVGKRDTLEAILRAIPGDTVALLDLQDKHITGDDLAPLIRGRARVWVMTSSQRHAEALKRTFAEDVGYVLRTPLFFVRHMLPMVLGMTNTMQLVVSGERERVLAYRDLTKAKR